MLKSHMYKAKLKKPNNLTGLIIILLVAIVGTALIVFSKAAQPYSSITADRGILSGGATSTTCVGALDGNCVKFGGPFVTGSCPLSTFNASNQPACWKPYIASSPFNTLVHPNPKQLATTASFQSHVAQYQWGFQGGSSGGNQFIVSDSGSRPIYFANNSDPLYKINCTNMYGGHGCQGENGVNVNGLSIHLPSGAKQTNNGDAHLVVVEVDTGLEYDMYHASVANNVITAGVASQDNTITQPGIRDQGDAAGISLLAGLLRPTELLSGQINHALALDVPCTTHTYVYPADAPDGEYCGQWWSESLTGAPDLGQQLFLNMSDAQIAASGAPTWEQTIMIALAHYGGYVEDTNGSVRNEAISIFKQDPASWSDLGAPDIWASTISKLGGTGSSLVSNVPIPIKNIVLLDPCVALKQC